MLQEERGRCRCVMRVAGWRKIEAWDVMGGHAAGRGRDGKGTLVCRPWGGITHCSFPSRCLLRVAF